jgi:hypothetical protein
MACFRDKGFITKTTDSGAGRSSTLPVVISYGRPGSLSRGVSCRQLVLQTGATLDPSLAEGRTAA